MQSPFTESVDVISLAVPYITHLSDAGWVHTVLAITGTNMSLSSRLHNLKSWIRGAGTSVAGTSRYEYHAQTGVGNNLGGSLLTFEASNGDGTFDRDRFRLERGTNRSVWISNGPELIAAIGHESASGYRKGYSGPCLIMHRTKEDACRVEPFEGSFGQVLPRTTYPHRNDDFVDPRYSLSVHGTTGNLGESAKESIKKQTKLHSHGNQEYVIEGTVAAWTEGTDRLVTLHWVTEIAVSVPHPG